MEIDRNKYYVENEQIPEDDSLSSIISVKVEDLQDTTKDDGLDPLVLGVRETIEDSEAKKRCEALHADCRSNFTLPSVDEFLRTYLQENGFLETLNAFQAEWFKFLHKGLINEEKSPVPDIFMQNVELGNLVKDLRSENFELKNSLLKLEKLHLDIKRIKEHYAEYEPILRMLRQKYETAMKEKTLHRIERDRAMNQVEGLRHALTSLQQLGITTNDQNDVDNITDCNRKKAWKTTDKKITMEYEINKNKVLTKSDRFTPSTKLVNNSTRAAICDLPVDHKVNPLLVKLKNHPYKFTRLDNRKLEMAVHGHEATVSKLAIHPIKSWLCSVSDDKSWKLWRIPKLELLMECKLSTDWLSSVDFHPQDEILAIGNGKGSIQIWKIQYVDDKPEELVTKRIGILRQHSGAVWSINWHWSGNYLASSGVDNTIRLWNIEYATMIYEMNKGLLNSYSSISCCTILRGHSKSVNSVQFLPYGNILVTGSTDRTVCLWDGRTGLCTNVISCDSGGFIRLWDLRKLNNYTFAVNLPTITTKTHTSTTTTNNNNNNHNNNNNSVDMKQLPTSFDLNQSYRKSHRSQKHHNQSNLHQKQFTPYEHYKIGANQLVIDLNSEYIVVACNDSKLYCAEILTGQISTLQGHEDSVQSVVLDYESGYLYSSSSDKKICSWI
ncbi:unnamed protein product [Heterobilharzia americana]|nr:unnamed protein product [Heterobilharzia americana]